MARSVFRPQAAVDLVTLVTIRGIRGAAGLPPRVGTIVARFRGS